MFIIVENKTRFLIITAMFALGFLVYFVYPANAAKLANLESYISSHRTGNAGNHILEFDTPSGVGVGENIVIKFSRGFDLNGIDYTDIDFSDDNTDMTLGAVPFGPTWGVEVSGNSLIITSGAGSIAPGSHIVIEIGLNATFQTVGDKQIINPASEGTYGFAISGTFGDYGNIATYIMANNTVSISAIVIGVARVNIRWATPELRVGTAETNDDSTFYLEVLTADDNDDVVLFTQSYLATTTNAGVYGDISDFIELTGVASGTYDVIIKTNQHVSKKLDNIHLSNGLNVLNFTTTDNSAPKGLGVLLAGDINGAGGDPASLGDNVVNSVDLPLLLNVLDDTDSTGNALRANLNQDSVVNSVDLSIMLKNLDIQGEK